MPFRFETTFLGAAPLLAWRDSWWRFVQSFCLTKDLIDLPLLAINKDKLETFFAG